MSAKKRAATPQFDRSSGPSLNFGSQRPGLFDAAGNDPIQYVGPTPARRCRTPAADTTGTTNRSASRPKSVQGHNTSAGPGLVTDGLRADPDGKQTLANFDPLQPSRRVMLDSPRSVKVCRRLGLSGYDFLLPSLEQVEKDMAKAGERTDDRRIVEMRHQYRCDRAAKKLAAARDELESLVVEEAAVRAQSSGEPPATSVQKQQRKMQQMLDANASRLRQQLLHRELLERQRKKDDEARIAQIKAAEREAEALKEMQAEKSRKEELARHLRAEAQEQQRQLRDAEMEARRREHEAKDRELKQRMAKQRALTEAEHDAKRQLNSERRWAMKEQSMAVMEERRHRFLSKTELVEERRRQFDTRRAAKRREAAIEAARKQEIIEATKRRCDEVIAAKAERTLQKELRAEQKREEEAELRAAQQREKQAELDRKAAHRQARYESAVEGERKRVQDLTDKIADTDAYLKVLAEQRDADARVKAELERHRMLDKRDAVSCRTRARQAACEDLERRALDKAQQVEDMKDQQAAVHREHRRVREEAERHRVKLEDPTPGPTDYLVSQGAVGTEAPNWAFGLPAAAVAKRQVSRDHHADGYVASPGPCRYAAEKRSKAPHLSICRSERWNYKEDAAPTPGPLDYAALTESPLRARTVTPS